MPRTKPCGSGLSMRARRHLTELGVWERIEPRAAPILGLRLVSPNGQEMQVAGKATGSVLNRRELDSLLVEAAREAGAEVREDCRVDGLVSGPDGAIGVRCGGEVLGAGWVVVATGFTNKLVSDPRPKRALVSCISWYTGVPYTPGVVEMIFDPVCLPHYGWLFPEPGGQVNIGLCLSPERLGGRSAKQVFADFLDRHFADRLAGATRVGGPRSHPIATTLRVEHHGPPGVLVAGEACRLVNPATGEGISYAVASGMLAAQTVEQARRKGWSRQRSAAWYQRRLRLATEKNFFAGELFCRFGTRALDTVTSLGNSRLVSRITSGAMGGI